LRINGELDITDQWMGFMGFMDLPVKGIHFSPIPLIEKMDVLTNHICGTPTKKQTVRPTIR
jgi:hypothetical protein